MKGRRVALLIALIAVPAPTRAAQDPKVARVVQEVDAVAARGPFAPNWASLARFKTPEWYEDAKFGVFIHWGVYSVPAFGNEWYPRNMYKKDEKEFAHHVATYGPQAKFGYKDFIPAVQGREVRRATLGGTLQGRGLPLRRSRGRAPRRLPHVRLLLHRLERRQDGAKARRGRRAGRRPSARKASSSGSPLTASSTGGSSARG